MGFLYFFILGHCPDLSLAEILGQIKGKVIHLSKNFLILETKEKLDAEGLQKKLGGTIKIGYVITQTEANFTRTEANLFLKELPKNKKVYFGFSLYGLDKKSGIGNYSDGKLGSRPKHQEKLEVKKLALEIKRKLKEKGISSRWVESRESALSSVIVQKNKLLKQGAEFCLLVTRTGTERNTDKHRHSRCKSVSNQYQSVYLGKTLSCQEFEEYEKVDYGRPIRNIEKGMLPLKLAKIMINLASRGRALLESATLLDPFCGSGTIVQEAVRLGYQDIVGTDISQKAINNTRVNLKWFTENYQLPITNYQLFQSDVKNLSQKISPNSIDAIVTEPYLGPMEKSKIKNQKSKIISELSELYLKVFEEFNKVLKKDGRIVIIFPILKIDGKLHFLPILDELKKLGWQVAPILPNEFKHLLTQRQSIIYSRPDQMVLREILIFKMRS